MKRRLLQKEIDDIVVKEADNDNLWGKWVSVNPARPISIRLSEQTISSLKTLAKLMHQKGYQTLLKKWITERLIYEQGILKEIHLAGRG